MIRKSIYATLALFICLLLTASLKATSNSNLSVSLSIRPVKQLTNYSCGLAGLSCIMDYWQVQNNREKLLNSHPPLRASKGYSLGELKRIATGKGLKAFAIHGSFEFLKKQLARERPVLVAVEIPYNFYQLQKAKEIPLVGELFEAISGSTFSHFMVVYGLSQKEIKVMDPMYGLKSIARDNFLDMWKRMKKSMLLVSA